MKKILAIILAAMMAMSMSSFALAEDIALDIWFSALVTQEEREIPQEEWNISKVARAFEEANPGVKINLIYQTDQQAAQNMLKASILAGEAPDLINMYCGYPVVAIKDVLVDISEYIPQEDLDVLVGFDGASAGDEIYGYPVASKEVCCFLYNKEIVAAAGVDLEGEGAPKNAEELMDAFRKIRDAGYKVFNADAGGCNSVYVFDFSAWWSQMSGVQGILSDSLGETKFAEDEGFLKSLQFCADMYKEGILNVDYETKEDGYTSFLNGECAFHATTTLSTSALEAMGDNLGVYALPNYSDDVAYPGYLIGGAGQVMVTVKGCESPEMAAKFMSFLNNKENTLSFEGIGMPLRTDITAEEMGRADNPVYIDYMQIGVDHSFNWNDNTMQSDVANEFYKISTMAVVGQMTVEECAAQLDQLAADVAENY